MPHDPAHAPDATRSNEVVTRTPEKQAAFERASELQNQLEQAELTWRATRHRSKVTCPDCGGRGETNAGSLGTYDCESCNGSGRVEGESHLPPAPESLVELRGRVKEAWRAYDGREGSPAGDTPPAPDAEADPLEDVDHVALAESEPPDHIARYCTVIIAGDPRVIPLPGSRDDLIDRALVVSGLKGQRYYTPDELEVIEEAGERLRHDDKPKANLRYFVQHPPGYGG